MSNNTARSETRRCSSLLYERIPHAPPLEHDRINCNQLTTNSLPTGKFTGNFKAHSQLAPRYRRHRAAVPDRRRCNSALPLKLKYHRHVLLLGTDQLGVLALDAVGERRCPFRP